MSIVSTRGLAVVALSLLGFVAAPASAQDAGALARACVQKMQQVTANHIDADRKITHRTVRAIRKSAKEGAPPRVLKQIAKNGAERIKINTAHGKDAIKEIATRCIDKLTELGANDRLIQAVRKAATGMSQKLDKAGKRSAMAIGKALAEALG